MKLLIRLSVLLTIVLGLSACRYDEAICSKNDGKMSRFFAKNLNHQFVVTDSDAKEKNIAFLRKNSNGDFYFEFKQSQNSSPIMFLESPLRTCDLNARQFIEAKTGIEGDNSYVLLSVNNSSQTTIHASMVWFNETTLNSLNIPNQVSRSSDSADSFITDFHIMNAGIAPENLLKAETKQSQVTYTIELIN